MSTSVLAGCAKICAGLVQRDDDVAAQSFLHERKPRGAAKLGGDAAFDQLRAEAALFGVADLRAPLFDPVDAENRARVAGVNRLPMNLDAPSGYGQGAI